MGKEINIPEHGAYYNHMFAAPSHNDLRSPCIKTFYTQQMEAKPQTPW